MRSRGLGDELLDLRATTRRVVRAGAALRALEVEARAQAIAQACARLRDDTHPYGRALRHELQRNSGLSPQGIAWGLTSTLETVNVEALTRLAQGVQAKPCELAAVILAGNVFSAAVRPFVLPLLMGVPVIAKASSRDDAMARYLRKTLFEVSPAVGDACAVATFARDQPALTSALLAHAQLVTVYGSDATVEAVRAQPLRGSLVARGHGLGACFVSAASVRADTTQVAQVARQVALDVAAYDQRGCLSPHAVIVQASEPHEASAFARVLFDALEALGTQLPPGPIPADAAAEQMQWRGVARVRGELHEGATCAVAFEGNEPLRPSPAHRNVGVYACTDEADLRAQLQAWSPHLKALGVAGDADVRTRLAATAPYVCEAGRMQTPPLDAPLDGLHPLHGLIA